MSTPVRRACGKPSRRLGDVVNHALTLYTALFFAIPFLTVSIWSGDIRKASGEALALLVYIGVLSLKLAIDDYIHFVSVGRSTPEGKAKLHRSLHFSLLMYLLLAAATAHAAMGNLVVAEVLLILAMLLGLWWMLGDPVPPQDSASQFRRSGWQMMNTLAILILVAAIGLQLRTDAAATGLIGVLIALVLIDAVLYGTLQRLAQLD
jgi:hypothetical protein